MDETYASRLTAINDALWLVKRGPSNPEPPDPAARLGANHMIQGFTGGYASSSREVAEDPRYAEIGLALDIARFLLDEEMDDDEEEAANHA
jgi:hypothetical protein